MASKAKNAAREMEGACIASRLRMLSRVVSGLYNDAFRPLGLRVSQGHILVVITMLEERATPGRIASVLSLEKSTVTRDVERMVRNGWLEKVPGQDARSYRLRLSTAGRRMLEKALPAWRRAQAQTERLLGSAGSATLGGLTIAAINGLARQIRG
jgi:DNA-binding MarR family transcriptional regulator